LKIAVAAAAGNVGRKVAAELLVRGEHQIRVLARRAAPVEHFGRQGADVLEGSLEDEEFLVRSTRGVDAMFWVTPTPLEAPDLRDAQRRMGSAGARALRENGIGRLVNLSGLGESEAGPLAGLRDAEQLLELAAVNTTHLRAAYFFENYLSHLDSIRTQGNIRLPVAGATRIPMIAARDVAWAAADRLLDTSWSGRHVCELHGPVDLRFDEAAALLSRALGRKVVHARVPEEEARKTWRDAGCSSSVADAFVEMYRTMEEGALGASVERSAATTTPTKLEEFGRTLLRPLLGNRVAF
jgi:uncharacterized protein YbjT (DUF2867 family)